MNTIPPKRTYARDLLQHSWYRRWLALMTVLALSCCALVLAT